MSDDIFIERRFNSVLEGRQNIFWWTWGGWGWVLGFVGFDFLLLLLFSYSHDKALWGLSYTKTLQSSWAPNSTCSYSGNGKPPFFAAQWDGPCPRLSLFAPSVLSTSVMGRGRGKCGVSFSMSPIFLGFDHSSPVCLDCSFMPFNSWFK